MAAVAEWRERHARLDVLLVRGNHDVRAGDPPADWRMRIFTGPCGEDGDGDIAFAHDPAERGKRTDHPGRFTLCGHLHPAIGLSSGPRFVRARCFSFGHATRIAVLPAFGSFTGSRCVEMRRGDQVLAVDGGVDVLDVTRAAL
jgi:metallophosphoesterase superfamily enzyme